MSGGSWDYLYFKIEEAADQLKHEKCEYRRAFADLMKKVSVAMHDIEWVDSCDKGEGDEIEAIKTALGDEAEKMATQKLIEDADSVIERLTKAVSRLDR